MKQNLIKFNCRILATEENALNEIVEKLKAVGQSANKSALARYFMQAGIAYWEEYGELIPTKF